MKNLLGTINYLIIIAGFLATIGCSNKIQVVNAWKGQEEAIDIFASKKVLVIARTNSQSARVAVETEFALKLAEAGIDVLASYNMFPFIDPEKEISEERRTEIIKNLVDDGFNGVVVTSVIDSERIVSQSTTSQSGVYVGGSFSGYYPGYYGNFNSYYGQPYGYGSYYVGGYAPIGGTKTTTSVSSTYVLETVGYNLDAPDDKRLVFVVNISLKDPQGISQTARDYVETTARALQDKPGWKR